MKFEVQELEHLNEMLREQALAAAGMTSSGEANVPVAGKIKFAPYIVYGQVLSYDEDKKVADLSGVAVALVKSIIELEVKVADCRTGNIVAIKTVVGHGQQKTMVSGEVRSSVGQGMRDAIDEAGHVVADWLREVLACPAKVLKIDKAEITIDMNENEVKQGDVFDVVEEGGVMVDPDSGATLEIDGNRIGRVAITHTGLQTSKAEPVEGGRLSLEKLDMRKHTYRLRRVSKEVLRKERCNECRKVGG